MTPPLVSIGIPTFRRPQEVKRAAESALAQDYGAVEVVVSDDAGGDETADVLAAIGDPRLRVVVQPDNLGHARNFQAVRELATGEYFMWLADDDWIDPGYVSACMRVLSDDPDCVLAVGQAVYSRPDAEPAHERPMNLLQGSAMLRTITYFATVTVNGPLYGIGPRAERPEFRESLGGDWVLVGSLAFGGRIRTVTDVHVHRSLVGMSTQDDFAAREFGVRGNRHLAAARNFARAIWSDEPTFAGLPAPKRAALAAAVLTVTGPRLVLIDLARAFLERTRILPVAQRLIAALRRS